MRQHRASTKKQHRNQRNIPNSRLNNDDLSLPFLLQRVESWNHCPRSKTPDVPPAAAWSSQPPQPTTRLPAAAAPVLRKQSLEGAQILDTLIPPKVLRADPCSFMISWHAPTDEWLGLKLVSLVFNMKIELHPPPRHAA